MTGVFERGAKVRVTRDLEGHEDLDRCERPKGFEFEVEEYYPAKPDAADGEISVAFYEGNVNGGFGNVAVPADAVELVMSHEAMAARRLPEVSELLKMAGEALMTEGNGFVVSEVDRSGVRTLEAFGRTDEGLAFGFRVGIAEVWLVDD